MNQSRITVSGTGMAWLLGLSRKLLAVQLTVKYYFHFPSPFMKYPLVSIRITFKPDEYPTLN